MASDANISAIMDYENLSAIRVVDLRFQCQRTVPCGTGYRRLRTSLGADAESFWFGNVPGPEGCRARPEPPHPGSPSPEIEADSRRSARTSAGDLDDPRTHAGRGRAVACMEMLGVLPGLDRAPVRLGPPALLRVPGPRSLDSNGRRGESVAPIDQPGAASFSSRGGPSSTTPRPDWSTRRRDRGEWPTAGLRHHHRRPAGPSALMSRRDESLLLFNLRPTVPTVAVGDCRTGPGSTCRQYSLEIGSIAEAGQCTRSPTGYRLAGRDVGAAIDRPHRRSPRPSS